MQNKQQTIILKQKNNKPASIGFTYFKFLLTSYFRKPYGYLVAAIYLLYLAIVLVIVPKALHNDPLFIWNMSDVNIQVVNLLFIASICGSSAIIIFRISRNDGTELTLSSKPITKLVTTLNKILIFVLIILLYSVASIYIGCLTLVFGWYDSVNNVNGITPEDFKGLILSLFVGNVICMLLFGSFAILISIVANATLTLVVTIGISFLLVFLNTIYPQILKSKAQVLNEMYNGATFTSFNLNTANQYNSKNKETKNLCTISNFVQQEGDQKTTYDIWQQVVKKSGSEFVNFVDVANQLSLLYQNFGMEQNSLQDSKYTYIGASNSFKYTFNKDNLLSKENIQKKNYPVFVYSYSYSQGKFVPFAYVLGNYLSSSLLSTWKLTCTFYNLKINSVATLSQQSGVLMLDVASQNYKKMKFATNSFDLTDLSTTEETQNSLKILYDDILNKIELNNLNLTNVTTELYAKLEENNYGLWSSQQKFSELSNSDRFLVLSKIQYVWSLIAQQEQFLLINEYNQNYSLPYSHEQIEQWFKDTNWWNEKDQDKGKIRQKKSKFQLLIFSSGLPINFSKDQASEWASGNQWYTKPTIKNLSSIDSINNMYVYNISFFHNIKLVSTMWSIVSILLFSFSAWIFKRIDFK